ncbi:hypothetical protein BP5796_04577 [Coleophoma crateriformis]|uniref:Ars binding protein 2 n=1 Tax=Coleophoma crateriformis TaxID=565419 RepID=A0A3D8S9R0_9HELO|nr:hypothetical protein BP5796_04577 [Coleophoma crateriformis]
MLPVTFQENTNHSLIAKYSASQPIMQNPSQSRAVFPSATSQHLQPNNPTVSSSLVQNEAPKQFTEQRLSAHQTQAGISPHSTNSTLAEEYSERRDLPDRNVSDENFDDAYIAFIFYCNPSVPMTTDTTELRKTLRAPPKSDGKSFNTYSLFLLIRKLEMKELKSWAQLATELGVEPPALDKGQSAQKVQQYAVRLKRWMHAMHVDAFFEYLLNKSHVYWTHVPSAHKGHSEHGRDGVVAEEDLALRALLPEMKPKRGRRKAGERDDDSELGKSPSQRPRLRSPELSDVFMGTRTSLHQGHMTPATAHPGFHTGFDDRALPPWSSHDLRESLGGSVRWPASREAQTPMTAYPQSAITPTTRNPMWNDTNEPRSAITPHKSRSRRRHGPAVSSAWPSNGIGSSGKLRGRPPSNRTVQDGPFTTFPVNSNASEAPAMTTREEATPLPAVPAIAGPAIQQFFPDSIRRDPPDPPNPTQSRPGRLSLQVPQRQGGAVRLATPPPVLMVNGTTEANMQSEGVAPNDSLMSFYGSTDDATTDYEPYVNITFRQNEDSDRTNVDSLESHFICEILAAEWYDASGIRIEKCSIDEASKICKQVIRNLQDESGSPEAFLMSVTALAGGPLRTHVRMTRLLEDDSRTDYECHWRMRFGSIEGDFTIKATVQHSVATAHGPDDEEIQVSWKKKYLDLQQRIRERDEKVTFLKKNVLDALVESDKMMMDRRGEYYPRSTGGR